MDDHPILSLHPEIVDDVTAGLAQRQTLRASATTEEGVAIVGAAFVNPVTIALVENLVRSALEYAAQTLGPSVVAGAAALKGEIRSVIGPAALDMADRIIHSLEDVKVAR